MGSHHEQSCDTLHLMERGQHEQEQPAFSRSLIWVAAQARSPVWPTHTTPTLTSSRWTMLNKSIKKNSNNVGLKLAFSGKYTQMSCYQVYNEMFSIKAPTKKVYFLSFSIWKTTLCQQNLNLRIQNRASHGRSKGNGILVQVYAITHGFVCRTETKHHRLISTVEIDPQSTASFWK